MCNFALFHSNLDNHKNNLGMKKGKMILIAALSAVLVACGGKGNMKMGDNEYPVRTISTQVSALQNSYPATIKGMQDIEIRPKVQGFITKLCVKEGQSVSAGQLLFVLDNVTYAEAAKQAQAAVKSAQAQLATARLTYNNNVQLHKENVIGDYQLQSAANALASANAALAQARANYLAAKQNLDYCYVKSPSAGVIGDLPYRVGALVSSSSAQPLTTVSNINTMYVYFSMTEKQLLDMTRKSGSTAKVVAEYPDVKLKLADGSEYAYSGHVSAVSGVINQTTGSVSMRADFTNPQHLLKSGGSGTILVPVVNHDAIVIPQDAVSQVQDKYFVYILQSNNKVKYSEITVSETNDGQNYVVTTGLKVGDKIAVAGVSVLSDGMEIKPITEDQYAAKLKKAEQLGSVQNDKDKLMKAFGK